MKASATRAITSFKVLVIDDQQQMRQIIRESLYRLGIRNVVMAGNAREALKAMQIEGIDVVLSDYNLGEGTDGQQLLEVARSTNVLSPVAPWIFITANSMRTDVLAAGDFTPDGYIVKPFTDQLLSRCIETHTARKALLAPLLYAIDAKKWDEVLTAADGFIRRGDSLSIEGMKQQGHALMKLGRFEEARAAYNSNKLLIAKSALATGGLDLGHGLIEAVARNNTDKPLMLSAALRAAQGTPVECACQDIVARAGADVQQALDDLLQAKRNADFIHAIEVGETALAVSPANFHIQIELCTLYLVAMGRACGKPEHATRAEDLLLALDLKHPNHTRVAAARKFYRERLASPVTAP